MPTGCGTIEIAHGRCSVPAPATARLLEGFTWRDDGIGGERVTPTGAAILRHLVDAASARVAGRLQGTGTGAGMRELPGQPNILRATLFSAGQPVDGLYVVVNGALGVYSARPAGGSQLTGRILAGETVGETDVITQRNRSATVVALHDTEVARLSVGTFEKLVASHLELPAVEVRRRDLIIAERRPVLRIDHGVRPPNRRRAGQ